MEDKKVKKISIFNILLDIIIIALVGVFAWMITEASRGEITEYSGKFIIVDSNVEVKFFSLIDNAYVEQSQEEDAPLLALDYLQPGASQKYRFDISNTKNVSSSTKIVFSGITGDIDLLKDKITVTCNNPTLTTFKLSERLKYEEETDSYYFEFLDLLKIGPEETETIYWNISIDSDATNEIQDTNILIDKIMFVYP